MRYVFAVVALLLMVVAKKRSPHWGNETSSTEVMTRLAHTTEESETTMDYTGTEIGVVNLSGANVRIRCQSILSDKRDVFLAPNHQLRFRFAELQRGNRHFWCDAYGLFGFKESFDVYGRSAPVQRNITWFIKPDGLYMDVPWHRVRQWKWDFPPLETYAVD